MPASHIEDLSIGLDTLPNWVPKGAQHYIAHTEQGEPIRALARAAGCHASTVMRQIRKVELLRDDPLVDAALRKLSALQSRKKPHTDKTVTQRAAPLPDAVPDVDTLGREAMRALRRLCEPGAVLAVAVEMDNAVVVREMPGGGSTRTAVVTTDVAQAMALKNWISAPEVGRITRYRITPTGRSALGDMIKDLKGGHGASGPKDDPAAFEPAPQGWDDAAPGEDHADGARGRYNTLGESPLITLSRRRDRDGSPFLSDGLVHAGERLREDFELAQMDSRTTQNWDNFLTAGAQADLSQPKTADFGPSDARMRVADALSQLGPGLSDVVLRCCCYLEGLETTEKRLGWSARSGKIVLRIALMRLKRHYDETIGPGGPLIG